MLRTAVTLLGIITAIIATSLLVMVVSGGMTGGMGQMMCPG